MLKMLNVYLNVSTEYKLGRYNFICSICACSKYLCINICMKNEADI